MQIPVNILPDIRSRGVKLSMRHLRNIVNLVVFPLSACNLTPNAMADDGKLASLIVDLKQLVEAGVYHPNGEVSVNGVTRIICKNSSNAIEKEWVCAASADLTRLATPNIKRNPAARLERIDYVFNEPAAVAPEALRSIFKEWLKSIRSDSLSCGGFEYLNPNNQISASIYIGTTNEQYCMPDNFQATSVKEISIRFHRSKQ